MIPSSYRETSWPPTVYQRGLVIDSQHAIDDGAVTVSISKGIGD